MNPVLYRLMSLFNEGNQYFSTKHPKFSQIELKQHLLPILQISGHENKLVYKEYLSWIEYNVNGDGNFHATKHEIKIPVTYTCYVGFSPHLIDYFTRFLIISQFNEILVSSIEYCQLHGCKIGEYKRLMKCTHQVQIIIINVI